MIHWGQSVASPDTPIRVAIKAIDTTYICVVIDAANRLLGTVTDGDVRRGILRMVSLEEPVVAIMNGRPQYVRETDPPDHALALMNAHGIRHLPVLDAENRVVGIAAREDLEPAKRALDNWVVLMAGGTGSRLQPLTKETPKPLIKVGPQPMLETTLETLVRAGFHRFYISVNYKAEMVKQHFGDGRRWNVRIQYLEEDEPLGTAGALSLIQELPRTPMLVMNGDLLTKVDFTALLDQHTQQAACATMGVREYDFQVPYGVARIDADLIIGIDEKPTHRFFVNAGIYILNPVALSLLKPQHSCDMPELFSRMISAGYKVAPFLVREYWIDVGRLDDLERAQGEFGNVFR